MSRIRNNVEAPHGSVRRFSHEAPRLNKELLAQGHDLRDGGGLLAATGAHWPLKLENSALGLYSAAAHKPSEFTLSGLARLCPVVRRNHSHPGIRSGTRGHVVWVGAYRDNTKPHATVVWVGAYRDNTKPHATVVWVGAYRDSTKPHATVVWVGAYRDSTKNHTLQCNHSECNGQTAEKLSLCWSALRDVKPIKSWLGLYSNTGLALSTIHHKDGRHTILVGIIFQYCKSQTDRCAFFTVLITRYTTRYPENARLRSLIPTQRDVPRDRFSQQTNSELSWNSVSIAFDES
ncbi:hypothetical protein RRG08_020547 [Elysia crispata]|uniref:Uncharacterized protein n=1 Tax=Elysia crispata TaxID=231223 RepID=A0AAE1A6A4_9GAST|nr:hypothetical protein RRG08_020547 [Elysia crispata]